eukprot:scaffold184393_cov28-Tisochrysis_lutea.AAC.4
MYSLLLLSHGLRWCGQVHRCESKSTDVAPGVAWILRSDCTRKGKAQNARLRRLVCQRIVDNASRNWAPPWSEAAEWCGATKIRCTRGMTG